MHLDEKSPEDGGGGVSWGMGGCHLLRECLATPAQVGMLLLGPCCAVGPVPLPESLPLINLDEFSAERFSRAFKSLTNCN